MSSQLQRATAEHEAAPGAATPSGMRLSSGSIEDAPVQPGHFPFRIAEGGESPYLRWIRDHANYMAVRGWSDYFRAISVMVRGAIVNFLVVLPVLLVTAVIVAAFKVWLYDVPFVLTQGLLGLTALVFVSYPARTFVAKFAGYRRSQETGTDSSVKQRDSAERRAGFLLVAIVAVAAVESLPLLLDPFHAFTIENDLGPEQLGSVIGIALAVLSGAGKVLSVLPRAASAMAKAALGLVGVLLPLVVVLSVAELLCFGPPPGHWHGYTKLATWILPALLLLGLVVGCVRGAFSLRGILVTVLLLACSVELARETVKLQGALWATLNEPVEQVGAGFAERLRSVPQELAKAVARQAGPRFRKVQATVEEVEDAVAERARHPEAKPRLDALAATPALPAGLARSLDHLEQAVVPELLAVELDDFVKVVRRELAASPSQADRLEAEVGRLVDRLAILEELWKPRAVEELVEHVRTLSNAELEGLGSDDPMRTLGQHPEQDYPTLLHVAEAELRALSKAMGVLSRMLSDARWELNQSAHAAMGGKASGEFVAEMRSAAFPAKALPVLMIALLVWGFCRLTVDVNLTSIHGLYRDRLASAFLVGADNEGDVDIEGDIDLGDLCCHAAGSTAPYHLINAALNLQGSSDIGLRDRRSDFFVFSKRFTGGARTGYCRSENMERVFPQLSLASAMAISAAAASPNMGRGTSPALVALMTMLNIRLGIWVPNPGVLQEELDGSKPRPRKGTDRPQRGFSFEQVFAEELGQIEARWRRLRVPSERRLAAGTQPTVDHGLCGVAFSGGGIRSAAVNLGIAQALERRGLFVHLDYMSTVSGGGYLGSSLSALMRRTIPTESELEGRVSVRRDEGGDVVVAIAPTRAGASGRREYRYSEDAKLAVEDGDLVKPGQRLLRTTEPESPHESFWQKLSKRRSFGEQFRWQVPSRALLWEMLSWLDETKRWVNLSDGGHIENLGAIELLRRRCRYVVIGDSEADLEHRFNSLATLIRTARLDLGVRIDIDTKQLRLRDGLTDAHWMSGRIHYPNETEPGYLLYFKSSIDGDEDEVIREYRHGHPSFPHESTADQMFDEAQFEAYRSLGQHMAEQPLYHLQGARVPVERRTMSFAELEQFFATLATDERDAAAAARA